jgi:signal recognition particle GTPase
MFGLRKTLGSLFGLNKVDDAWYEHLEELLLKADVGVATTDLLITSLRKAAKSQSITNADDLKEVLVQELSRLVSTNKSSTRNLVDCGRQWCWQNNHYWQTVPPFSSAGQIGVISGRRYL